MKTAAAIVVVLALVSILNKEKKHHPPPVFDRTVVVDVGTTPPDTTAGGAAQATQTQQLPSTVPDAAPAGTDDRPDRIVNFAKSAFRKNGAGDVLRRAAESIVKYSDQYGVDYALAAALCARESRFNPNAVSAHGAKGLFQMIDSTARNMGISDPYDIDQNAGGGIKYFKLMMDRWSGLRDQTDRALASFLQGPRVVENCDCVPDSSRKYLDDIYDYRNRILGQ